MYEELKREDYTEPACPFCTDHYSEKKNIKRIDVSRIIAKYDEHIEKNDTASAARHLEYWLSEARFNGDGRGELAMHNELMGHYRKENMKEKALSSAERALSLLESENMGGTLTEGTVLVNAATVFKAFGKAADSLPLYRKAEEIYRSTLENSDPRLGGLYNNMALALVDVKSFDEAQKYYSLALEVMNQVKNGELEQAMTYLNMANAAELSVNEPAEIIDRYIETAMRLLDTPSLPRNAYYAFVCEKCAGTFGYYGYFFYKNQLVSRAAAIRKERAQ